MSQMVDAFACHYGINRCRRCGIQRVEGPECGACGAPNSERQWIDVVPRVDYQASAAEIARLRGTLALIKAAPEHALGYATAALDATPLNGGDKS